MTARMLRTAFPRMSGETWWAILETVDGIVASGRMVLAIVATFGVMILYMFGIALLMMVTLALGPWSLLATVPTALASAALMFAGMSWTMDRGSRY